MSSNLFTAIWRLEKQGHFTLHASQDLGFPAVDFFQLDKRLTINILNLIGVDSSLPHYLLELAIHNQAFANFLIIFNEQFYRLLYAVWKNVHPLASQQGYQQLIVRLLGLHEQAVLLPYVDCWLLTPGIVSLRKCLKKLLGPIAFSLTEYADHWFELDNVVKLGGSSYLNNCLLGLRFFTNQYCIDCKIGPIQMSQSVDLACLKELLPYFTVKVKIKVTLFFDDTLVRLGKIKLGEGCLYPTQLILGLSS